MNYGLYVSAGGALASMHRQDVIANNLANANTIGFKPDEADVIARLPARIESQNALVDPQILLEQIGGGALLRPTRINLNQGDLLETSNDLDLAIRGEGFFVIQSNRGGNAAANENIRMTRDGRFTLNAAGELVMAATGLRVLDTNNQPIRLQLGGAIRIDASGQIRQNDVPVARIQIATAPDVAELVKEGASLLRSGPGKPRPAGGEIVQRSVESSAVDPILTLNAMINVSKAVAANATMMQYHDTVMGQAINTFGRVA